MEVGNPKVTGMSLELDVSAEEFEMRIGDGGLLSRGGYSGTFVVVGVMSFELVSVGYCVLVVSLMYSKIWNTAN